MPRRGRVRDCRKSRRVNTPRYYLKGKRVARVAEAPDAPVPAGTGYGNVSGRTRTATMTFKGYRPVVGNVSSTNAALQPCRGAIGHCVGADGGEESDSCHK